VCFDGAAGTRRRCASVPGKGGPNPTRPRPARNRLRLGAALFVRAEVIREVGAFDDRYFLSGRKRLVLSRARARLAEHGRARREGLDKVALPSARRSRRCGSTSPRAQLVWLFRHGTFGERVRAC